MALNLKKLLVVALVAAMPVFSGCGLGSRDGQDANQSTVNDGQKGFKIAVREFSSIRQQFMDNFKISPSTTNIQQLEDYWNAVKTNLNQRGTDEFSDAMFAVLVQTAEKFCATALSSAIPAGSVLEGVSLAPQRENMEAMFEKITRAFSGQTPSAADIDQAGDMATEVRNLGTNANTKDKEMAVTTCMLAVTQGIGLGY